MTPAVAPGSSVCVYFMLLQAASR